MTMNEPKKKITAFEKAEEHLVLLKQMGQEKSACGKHLNALVKYCEELKDDLKRTENQRDHHHREWMATEEKLLASNVDGLVLEPGNVEWVVNSIAELGVKIGNQFFFMYKARSLVYDREDTEILWRHCYKREFGETVTVPPKTEHSFDRGELDGEHHYSFGEGWAKFP